MVQNPIVRGMFPDPSIIYAEGAYYMVHSSFQYFPAIPISRSTDLVNWEIVGHGIDNPDWLDLTDIPDSHGIWAPDISFSNGKYWIFAPLRLSGEGNREKKVLRRQLVMWAEHPEGPYSKPVCLEADFIDPSHFVDTDGKHYMITAPGITVTPISNDCSEIIGDSLCVWAGTGEKAPEGPHVFMKDGLYYAILAEGGTGYGHRVTVARSAALMGPYEICPHNPILKQNDETARLQRCGHAMFFELPDGRWYAMYLCARPVNGRYTVLGRETSLQEITWDNKGWPHMADPQNEIEPPFQGTIQKINTQLFDDFNGPINSRFRTIRTPNSEREVADGCLRIWTGDFDVHERRMRNATVVRETEHCYRAETRLTYAPEFQGEQAGLLCYYDTKTYIKLSKVKGGLELRFDTGDGQQLKASVPYSYDTVDLAVNVNGLERTFYFRAPDGEWKKITTLENCIYLADEGANHPKRHTGTMVGMFATNGSTGIRRKADFDWFCVKCI